MQRGPVTPKGFRDILPENAKKRRLMISTIESVLERYGFVPLETPTLEFAETLLGKYGDEEKLIYRFKDRGGRDLALRYDLTVPLARFVANNLGVLKPSFSRYQVGQVFRGENPQKGRFREFTQFDFDTVGSDDVREDAKVIAAAITAAREIGLGGAIMLINDRRRFFDIPVEAVRVFDKLDKIGPENVAKELKEKGFSDKQIEEYREKMVGSKIGPLDPLFNLLEKEYKLKKGKDFEFAPALARGLDYYTSTVFELKLNKDAGSLSVGGGGRYDNLIGIFAGRQIPAVGFSFGLDRILDLI
jgi:histidyl-tRNA synthetase